MKQQLRVTFLMIMVALLCLGAALPGAAQADSAQVRIGHFVFDGTAVNLYVDGVALIGNDTLRSVFNPMTLPDNYLEFSGEAHTFAAVVAGEPLESAIIPDQEFILEAGHSYIVALMGNVAADDLHFILIDETAALEQYDISLGAVDIQINNLYGVAGMDGYFAGESYYTNLAYGDYTVIQDANEGRGSLFTVHDQPDQVIFEYADAVTAGPEMLALFVFSGTYPGDFGEDYSGLYVVHYIGELSITDGGVIAVGDTLPVNIMGMGQRVQFTLTLDANTTLDILQSGAIEVDSYLRLYNAAGDLLFGNDEVTDEDNPIYDAGWNGLTLEAGTYTLEASVFADAYAADFTLSVREAR